MISSEALTRTRFSDAKPPKQKHRSILGTMAVSEFTPPVNGCEWITKYRNDGTSYRAKISDCGQTDCKWSSNYIPQ
ncbi:hypothetical protein B0H63DRAFT_133565 [Podospora didyma]|uniref:Uncharacterized protein n=1 Tax=Podospora didyma TaxID=330526 RepID=A0AAE0U516_9PEZI|nr:hypothetical protein B0H63DRAFT_133565 [Podospora didyma]